MKILQSNIIFLISSIFLLFLFLEKSITAELDLNNIVIKNLKGDESKLVDLIKTKESYIVLYHNFNCFKCFYEIKNDIDSIKNENKDFDYIVVIRCQNDIVSKLEIYKELAKIFDKDKLFFDIHNSEDKWAISKFEEGLFSLFSIKYTPALIKKENNSFIYYPYNSIFKNKK